MMLRTVTLAALVACAGARLHAQEFNDEPRSRPGWSLERTQVTRGIGGRAAWTRT